jgi:hypothetical protein
MWNCLRRKKRLDREFIVSQVLARHAVWFPAHNRGREAPVEALDAWARQLRDLPEAELILLLADNRSRNRQLGMVWPPGGQEGE